VSCGVGCRRGSDPALLWLWRRLAATAPIQPLAWEPPYAAGVAQEMAKSQKKKKKMKWQPMEWMKIFTNHISDKGLIFKLCKELTTQQQKTQTI